MIHNFIKIQALIKEYRQLSKLQGFTPQSRGQRLNSFFSELLQCWGIKATSNIRQNGEIDVGFSIDARHYIAEVKWEDNPISTGPIAKLQKRLRQRLGGTVGIFLSMSDFSPEALKDLKDGEQLMVLLLSKKHLEAMLSGFIPPQELINTLITKASLYGEGFVPLESLFEITPPEKLEVNFNAPHEISAEELVKESIYGFQANTIVSNLPFGQSGVAELEKNKVLLTLKQGIYILDLNKHTFKIWFGMPDCSRNLLVTKNGAVFIVRKTGVAYLKDGKFDIIGGGFCGNICLFHGRDEDVWIFSNGFTNKMDGLCPMIIKLGNFMEDEKRYEIDFAPAHGTNAAFMSNGSFLIIGTNNEVAIIEYGISKQTLKPNLTNPMGLVYLSEDRFVIASDVFGGVGLSELDIRSKSVTQIARLKLQGSISELAKDGDRSGYLFSHYSKANRDTAGILIHWEY